MKRFLLIISICLFAQPALAQRPDSTVIVGGYVQHTVVRSLNANNTGVVFRINPGNTVHQFSFNPASTVSAVTVDIQAAGGDGTYVSRGTSTVAAGATINFLGNFRNGKVVITNYTGSGYIDFDYWGSPGISSVGSDPCMANAKLVAPISIASATTTQIIAANSVNKVYICFIDLFPSGANNVALVEDATGSCASPDAGMAGGTTSGTGWIFAAAGQLVLGNGSGTVTATASRNVNVCLITSGAGQMSGVITYVLAP